MLTLNRSKKALLYISKLHKHLQIISIPTKINTVYGSFKTFRLSTNWLTQKKISEGHINL